jgi:MFS family permease
MNAVSTVTLVASLGGFLFGADIVLVALALPYMARGGSDPVEGINTSLNQSLVVGVAKLMAVVGVFFGLTVANSYGRITALWSAAIGYMLGPATLSVAENMGEIMVGRVLIGVSIGMSAVVVPMYVAEMSSNVDRGKNVATYELLLACGTCFAAASDALLRPEWRKMMLVVIPFAVLLFLLSMFLLVESPRYLLEQDRKEDAKEVLKRLLLNKKVINDDDEHFNSSLTSSHGQRGGFNSSSNSNSNSNKAGVSSYESNAMNQSISVQERKDAELERLAETELNQIARTLDQQNFEGGGGRQSEEGNNNNNMFEHAKRIVAKIKSLRSNENAFEATKILIALAAFNQLSGSTAVINYAPRLLAGGQGSQFDSVAHSTSFAISITITKLLGVAVGVYFVDCHSDDDEREEEHMEEPPEEEEENKKFYGGRVSLLFYGGIAASLSLFFAAFGVVGHEYLVLIGLCLFTFFFSCSWAPVFWVLVSESFENEHKSAAITVCVASLFFFGAVADFYFLPFIEWNEGVALTLAGCIQLWGAIFAKRNLKETSGKSLKTISESYGLRST